MFKILGADGKEYGPVTADQLKQWIAEGRANQETKAQREGETDWKSLNQFAEFAASFAAATPPGPTSYQAPSPTAASGGLVGAKPSIPNYLVQSILVTLCCCLPGGIVAIVYAAQVNSKLGAGDIAGAQDASGKAKMWCWISFGVGLVVNLIAAAIQIFAISAAGAGGRGF